MGARSTGSHPTTTKADGHLLEYFRQNFGVGGGANSGPNIPPQGHTATGGIISDYIEPGPGTVYRAHVFTSSGAFNVTKLGTLGNTVDYLVVAGGGAGGVRHGGGGGAGGLRTGTDLVISVQPYPVIVGAGGAIGAEGGTAPAALSPGRDGNPSSFGPIASSGGGGGGGTSQVGRTGGSGGGGSSSEGTGGAGNSGGYTPPEGSNGGQGAAGPEYAGGGGGGAGDSGGNGSSTGPGGSGGPGVPNVYAYGPTNPVTYAGGGGGGMYFGGSGGSGGPGGGGAGADGGGPVAVPGSFATGGGGGGGGGSPDAGGTAGSGGSGIVVVRYKIAEITAQAKATGGAVSFYNDMTIHTFTNSGTFASLPTWVSSTSVEYVIVGGGGGGVGSYGGGGGGGTYKTGSTPFSGPFSFPVSIGAGGASPVNYATTANQGTQSFSAFPTGTITSPGGGGGAAGGSGARAGGPGGSGGGSAVSGTAGPATGAPFPGTIGTTPPAGWGHNGGVGGGSPSYGGGGGGGAGGVGGSGDGSDPGSAGNGGVGMQLPSTFRDPVSTVGAPGPTSPPFIGADTSGKYWVAGGGGGGPYGAGGTSTPGTGGAGGGGNGGDNSTYFGTPGKENTGGGGGGSRTDPGDGVYRGGIGGSGIVLIAYPT